MENHEMQEAYEKAYFDRSSIIEHAKDTVQSGQFISNIMFEFFELMENKNEFALSQIDFYESVRNLCQQLREDTAEYVAKND